jgi:magnesium chelatase family protein
MAARAIQTQRFAGTDGVYANAHMSSKQLQELCVLPEAAQTLLKQAMERLQLSARAYDRILKVARTIADLAGTEHILTVHLAEAIQFRSLDRENWGT